MQKIWQRISAEPALITGAIMATANVIAAFRAWTPTPEQLAAINSALAAVFGLLVRATVAPTYGTPVRLRRATPRKPGNDDAGPSPEPARRSRMRESV